MDYVGRLAPTPTGPLHFGSLLAALASYCDARRAGGQWLLRIEDIDPPREIPGAADTILRQLEHYGLNWDGPVVYQSQRSDAYLDAIDNLRQRGLVFWCRCSRSQLAGHSVYPGTCRHQQTPLHDAAIRLRVTPGDISFTDRVFGPQHEEVCKQVGDFVIRRRDGLFAYQLAVVVDDAASGITDVVRGADLLDNTARQIYLQQCLGYPQPRYAHLPLAVNAVGEKLSKQNLATPLPNHNPAAVLILALELLGQTPPTDLAEGSLPEVLHWATTHWAPEDIPHQTHLPINTQVLNLRD